jgi:hypothetical protein
VRLYRNRSIGKRVQAVPNSGRRRTALQNRDRMLFDIDVEPDQLDRMIRSTVVTGSHPTTGPSDVRLGQWHSP